MKFDVFLSHNSKDKPVVRELARRLAERDIRVWLDKDELIPGRNWQPLLEQGIEQSSTSAVLVGKDGFGPWEDEEMQGLLRQAVRSGKPVIPVLLPSAPKKPKLPLFLTNRTWVDLRDGLTDQGLDNLVWGITGIPADTSPAAEERRVSRGLWGWALGALLIALTVTRTTAPPDGAVLQKTATQKVALVSPSSRLFDGAVEPAEIGGVSRSLPQTKDGSRLRDLVRVAKASALAESGDGSKASAAAMRIKDARLHDAALGTIALVYLDKSQPEQALNLVDAMQDTRFKIVALSAIARNFRPGDPRRPLSPAKLWTQFTALMLIEFGRPDLALTMVNALPKGKLKTLAIWLVAFHGYAAHPASSSGPSIETQLKELTRSKDLYLKALGRVATMVAIGSNQPGKFEDAVLTSLADTPDSPLRAILLKMAVSGLPVEEEKAMERVKAPGLGDEYRSLLATELFWRAIEQRDEPMQLLDQVEDPFTRDIFRMFLHTYREFGKSDFEERKDVEDTDIRNPALGGLANQSVRFMKYGLRELVAVEMDPYPEEPDFAGLQAPGLRQISGLLRALEPVTREIEDRGELSMRTVQKACARLEDVRARDALVMLALGRALYASADVDVQAVVRLVDDQDLGAMLANALTSDGESGSDSGTDADEVWSIALTARSLGALNRGADDEIRAITEHSRDPYARLLSGFLLSESANGIPELGSDTDQSIVQVQRLLKILTDVGVGNRSGAQASARKIEDPVLRVWALSLIGGDALREARSVMRTIKDVPQQARARLFVEQATLGLPQTRVGKGQCWGFCASDKRTVSNLQADDQPLFGKAQAEWVTQVVDGNTTNTLETGFSGLGMKGAVRLQDSDRMLIYQATTGSKEPTNYENSFFGATGPYGTLLEGIHTPASYVTHAGLIPLSGTRLSPSYRLPRMGYSNAAEPSVLLISPNIAGLQMMKRFSISDQSLSDGGLIYSNGPLYLGIGSRLRSGENGALKGGLSHSVGLRDWNGLSLASVHHAELSTNSGTGSELFRLPIASSSLQETLLISAVISVGNLRVYYFWTEETSKSRSFAMTSTTVAAEYRFSREASLFVGRKRLHEPSSNGSATERSISSHGFSLKW